MAFESSQGVEFMFDNAIYKATSVAVSKGRQEFDVSTTELADNSFRRLRLGKFDDIQIKVDWLGSTLPPTKGAAKSFTLSGGLGVASGFAICTGVTISGVAGDLIKGSATFKVSNQ